MQQQLHDKLPAEAVWAELQWVELGRHTDWLEPPDDCMRAYRLPLRNGRGSGAWYILRLYL